MKALITLFVSLFITAIAAKAQTEPAYGCTIKKDGFATYKTRQNTTIPVKVGEQYTVLGAAGRMLEIDVKAKHYYIANGNVTLFKTTQRNNSAVSDTTFIPYDSLPVIKEEGNGF